MDSRVRGRRNYISYTEYVEGNAVRKQMLAVPQRREEVKSSAVPQRREEVKSSAVPQRTERVYVDNQRVTTTRRAIRHREKALQMSIPYVIMLAMCLCVMVYLCAEYLTLRSDVSDITSKIATMEINTDSLRAHNDSIEYGISSYKDIDYITNSAITELGMVKATADQIIFYESSESEYMKQYRDIPSN